MSTVTPFLWFNDQAGEAAAFYLSLFPGSRRLSETKMKGAGPGLDEAVSMTTIEMQGTTVTLFNGGPHFTLNEAFSFSVTCKDQQEIDTFWEKLTDGGMESRCGWLKDRFGVSWQVVPENLGALLRRPGAMKAMMAMKKLDIATLEAAGRP